MEADNNSLPSSTETILIEMKLVHKLLKIMWHLCCAKWDRDQGFLQVPPVFLSLSFHQSPTCIFHSPTSEII